MGRQGPIKDDDDSKSKLEPCNCPASFSSLDFCEHNEEKEEDDDDDKESGGSGNSKAKRLLSFTTCKSTFSSIIR